MADNTPLEAITADATTRSNKPAVLIIGGLGYVGRFLALHIHQSNLASEVRLVDKQLPELAWLSPEMSEACPRANFMQADASREQSLARIFTRPDPSREYDYVFNCGGETRYSQDDAVYRLRSHALSLALGTECARRHIPVYVELSTGQVYKPSRTPCTESSKLKPWLRLARWKLKAEEDLGKVKGLDVVVLRLAHVYGPYVSRFLGTACCMARVYQGEGKEMRWLWDAGLRTNTVHVEDVSRALWRAAEWYVQDREKRRGVGGGSLAPARPIPVFNIVDHGDTSQGTLSTLLSAHFSIPTSFAGTLLSAFARLNLDSVVDDVNDETLDPWAALLVASGKKAGPISPFMEKEALMDRDLCMDGGEFERVTGFVYQRQKLGPEGVREVVESYERMGWWP